jgi:hypothetical protein
LYHGQVKVRKVRRIDVATKLKITYLDGKVVEVVAPGREQVLTEQHFKGISDANAVQAGFFLAWASLRRAGKELAEFEPWLDQVQDVDKIEDVEVDPTKEDLPPASSSNSASPPESPSSS